MVHREMAGSEAPGPLAMTACAKNPCSTCPYRRDTPPGLWHSDEYLKLPDYDDDAEPPALGLFLCHQSNEPGAELTICKGWLTVHAESIAVRLALICDKVTRRQIDRAPTVALYDSGAEAAAAGLAGVENPGPAARRAIDRLTRKLTRRTTHHDHV